ncbi:MAG: O-antigen ligase domain-containing protein [Cyanobacteria bacterium P01_F01_bin.86]
MTHQLPPTDSTAWVGKDQPVEPQPPDDIKPQNFPERVVWYSITGTYFFFLLGSLYILGSVIAWILFLYLLLRYWLQDEQTPLEERIQIPITIWIWMIGMLVMEVALVMGHLDYDLGTKLLVKSSIGWAKGWAVLALYPLVGCLPIRPELIYRATCKVCWHTLLLAPIYLPAPFLKLPQILYVSPLRKVGGPGPNFFDVSLYSENYAGELRWRLFAPWGPALGMVGIVYLVFALQEKNKRWRLCGILGSLLMCYVSKSRLAQLCVVIIPCLVFVLSQLKRPTTLIGLGIGSFVSSLKAPELIQAFNDFWAGFKGARADSTRVRMALKEIAGYRWRTEAYLWGHGVVEQGPHLVETMPIGSHHTWYGLLFVKGIVGFYALAVPMAISFIVLLWKAQNSDVGRAGLAVLCILFLYTFGENLEILAYLYWPGLVIMGIALKPKPQQSYQVAT